MHFAQLLLYLPYTVCMYVYMKSVYFKLMFNQKYCGEFVFDTDRGRESAVTISDII